MDAARFTAIHAPEHPMSEDPASYQVGGDHYRTLTVQLWEALESWMTVDEFRGFMRGNVIKYLARNGSKADDPCEDLLKARHYLDRLIATYRQAPAQASRSLPAQD
jgi:hypothetical protein